MLIDGEIVIGVVHPESELSRSFAASADQVIDATGMYLVPGGIDAHTHLQATGQIAPVLDTFETGTVASAFGGTTTIIDFAFLSDNERLPDGFERHQATAAGECAVDYGFHMMVSKVDGQSPKEMDLLVDEGVTSFKMFMAYPGRLYSDDGQILRMMQQAAENGSLIQMHAENGIAIDVLRDQAVERGDVDPLFHGITRSPILEAEAVHRAVALSEVAGSPLYIVHLSSANALEEVIAARDRGLNVFAETCPQYLFLDLDDLDRPTSKERSSSARRRCDQKSIRSTCGAGCGPMICRWSPPTTARSAGSSGRSVAATSETSQTVCRPWSTGWS